MTNVERELVERLLTVSRFSLAFIAKKVGVPVGTHVGDFFITISITSEKRNERGPSNRDGFLHHDGGMAVTPEQKRQGQFGLRRTRAE
jgi:hypothetical protein